MFVSMESSQGSLFPAMDAMLLRNLIADEWRDAEYLSVKLTDGTFLPVIPKFNLTANRQSLVVTGSAEEAATRHVLIPLSEIADIKRPVWDTGTASTSSGGKAWARSSELSTHSIFADLSSLAEDEGLNVIEIAPRHFFKPTGPIRSGQLSTKFDQILYHDTRYFERAHREGKSVELGLTLFGFGGNLGFSSSTSLLQAIQKAMKKKRTTSIAAACQESTVQLRAYAHLLSSPHKASTSQLRCEDDGKWLPALVSSSADEPDGAAPMCVAYFVTRGFVIAAGDWKFRAPMRMFGEIVHQELEIPGYGTAGCFLRVRAAALLASDATE
jgi:hypothetical protein